MAFQEHEPLGARDDTIEAGLTAHLFAYLRINPRVTPGTARLTTGWLGLTLAGREAHPVRMDPLDDKLGFNHRYPPRPALPGRFYPSCPPDVIFLDARNWPPETDDLSDEEFQRYWKDLNRVPVGIFKVLFDPDLVSAAWSVGDEWESGAAEGII